MTHGIEVHREQLPCQRCAKPLLLTVHVPHSLTRPDQVEIPGWRTVSLCPCCDHDEPAVQGILAFFTVHQTITAETVHDAGPVLRQWIDHVTAHPPSYTDTDLDEDIRLWEAGET